MFYVRSQTKCQRVQQLGNGIRYSPLESNSFKDKRIEYSQS